MRAPRSSVHLVPGYCWLLAAITAVALPPKTLQESRVPRKQTAPVAQSDEKYADTHIHTQALYPPNFTPDFTFSLRCPLLFTMGADGHPSP
ncbi:hypothetical protein B0H67DRAFT_336364 [Lasiosphaeris hirsuta]|uniref:Uncharacterized protein n=1 Tax=Lasiosphaeris hirsuta TaxID=260670 RepID=A0AA40DM68_9PEZI|nr:hypothetical protein B0H67DRAFT_336364 [Lasiosphaeris hirsuta]